MKVKVIKNRCPQNHPCPSIQEDKCTKCGKCIRFCPMGAIQLVEE